MQLTSSSSHRRPAFRSVRRVLRSVSGPNVVRIGAIALAGIGVSASWVAAATAAPVTAAGTIMQHGDAYRGSQLGRAVTTVDPATGEWSTRVSFSVPQTAANAADLLVSLKPVGKRLPAWTWTTNTDLAKAAQPATVSQRWLPTAFNGTPLPAEGASVAFEPGNTTLVLRAVSPSLVGVDPDVVGVSLNRPGTEQQVSVATAFLGPRAPKIAVQRAARTLTLRSDRTIDVPLAALSRPAARRVALYIGRTPVGVKTLPAKYSRRTVATVRLSAKDAARIARAGRVKLAVRAWLDNGSTSTDGATVTVRRTGA